MIDALDSAFPPTLAQASAARAGGVRLWNGYMAARSAAGLLNTWSLGQFQVVHSVFGAPPVAFCSGWDDPAAVRAQGVSWGVRPCLDVESGIRDDGPWVDGWLATSGAGLYGLIAVHDAHPQQLPFRIAADYPSSGDPLATWPLGKGGAPPAEPHGWQWAGSHTAYGVTVDSEWLDDWFLQGDDVSPTDQAILAYATAYGPEYSITAADIENGVNNLGAGMTWTQLYQALLSNPPAVAYRQKLASIGAATAVADHVHQGGPVQR